MRRFLLFLLVLVWFVPVTSAQGTPIQMHFAESADIFMTEGRFGTFSFDAEAGQLIHIVAYSMDEDMQPRIELFSPMGAPISDYAAETDVAHLSFVAEESGRYSFLISRQSENSGLMRIMLFEGAPLDGNISLQDFADPNLPSRAYLIEGRPADLDIEIMADDPETVFFVSRGEDDTVPPIEERITPVASQSWQNEDGTEFYTVNVRALPEWYLIGDDFDWQALPPFTYQIDLGVGSDEVIQIERPETENNVVPPDLPDDYQPTVVTQVDDADDDIDERDDADANDDPTAIDIIRYYCEKYNICDENDWLRDIFPPDFEDSDPETCDRANDPDCEIIDEDDRPIIPQPPEDDDNSASDPRDTETECDVTDFDCNGLPLIEEDDEEDEPEICDVAGDPDCEVRPPNPDEIIDPPPDPDNNDNTTIIPPVEEPPRPPDNGDGNETPREEEVPPPPPEEELVPPPDNGNEDPPPPPDDGSGDLPPLPDPDEILPPPSEER